MIDWQQVDQITSKCTALLSLVFFTYLFLRLQFGSSIATLKVMAGLFVFGWVSNFSKMYLGRVFGICNVTARALTILAPMVAEAEEPVPESTIFLTCLIAAILSRNLKP